MSLEYNVWDHAISKTVVTTHTLMIQLFVKINWEVRAILTEIVPEEWKITNVLKNTIQKWTGKPVAETKWQMTYSMKSYKMQRDGKEGYLKHLLCDWRRHGGLQRGSYCDAKEIDVFANAFFFFFCNIHFHIHLSNCLNCC